jgi:hypothetical protein
MALRWQRGLDWGTVPTDIVLRISRGSPAPSPPARKIALRRQRGLDWGTAPHSSANQPWEPCAFTAGTEDRPASATRPRLGNRPYTHSFANQPWEPCAFSAGTEDRPAWATVPRLRNRPYRHSFANQPWESRAFTHRHGRSPCVGNGVSTEEPSLHT